MLTNPTTTQSMIHVRVELAAAGARKGAFDVESDVAGA